MRIKIMSENALNTIKSNLPTLFNEFHKELNSFIIDFLEYDPYIDTKYEIDHFDLDTSNKQPQKTDFINVKNIYENLKFLTNSEASDERLWAWLSTSVFDEYVKYRWNIQGNQNFSNVLDHYFFGNHSPRRSLTRNAIARLWWIGRLTYDATSEDPYKYTKFVCENQDNIQNILERNVSNNLMIIKPFVDAVLKKRTEGLIINTDDIGELMKYINMLGSVYLLDFQTYDWIFDKICNRIDKLNGRKYED